MLDNYTKCLTLLTASGIMSTTEHVIKGKATETEAMCLKRKTKLFYHTNGSIVEAMPVSEKYNKKKTRKFHLGNFERFMGGWGSEAEEVEVI